MDNFQIVTTHIIQDLNRSNIPIIPSIDGLTIDESHVYEHVRIVIQNVTPVMEPLEQAFLSKNRNNSHLTILKEHDTTIAHCFYLVFKYENTFEGCFMDDQMVKSLVCIRKSIYKNVLKIFNEIYPEHFICPEKSEKMGTPHILDDSFIIKTPAAVPPESYLPNIKKTVRGSYYEGSLKLNFYKLVVTDAKHCMYTETTLFRYIDSINGIGRNKKLTESIARWMVAEMCSYTNMNIENYKLPINDDKECPVCRIERDRVILTCNHRVCPECFLQLYYSKCPMCRHYIEITSDYSKMYEMDYLHIPDKERHNWSKIIRTLLR